MSDILDAARPCFMNVLLLRELAGNEHVEAASLRRQLVADVVQMEREALTKGVTAKHVSLVKYAVIAITDEVAQAGPLASYWTEHQLQAELLGDTNAGQGLFLHLDTLLATKAKDEASLDVLEVYALCLFFGFRGKYAARVDAIGFEALRKRVEDRLAERIKPRELLKLERAEGREPPVVIPKVHRWVGGLAMLFALSMLVAYKCQLVRESTQLEEYLREAGTR